MRRSVQVLVPALTAVLLIAGCAVPIAKPAPTTTAIPALAPAEPNAVLISRDPTSVPAPITRAEARTVVVNLETKEVTGQLADGRTFSYWTFGGQVPGPLVRVKVGDTVEVHLKNNADSKNVHSIDLHAVFGPGGGAMAMQAKPGEEKVFTFKAMNPGAYVYHCASPHIPTHIAMGMYGMIVVDPPGGWTPVDKEFYVMQGEIYTAGDMSAKGHQQFDGHALMHEDPNFVVFNGAFDALTGDRAMHAKVGDKIRIFVGNGGPNLASSFHIMGLIMDKVHVEGAAEATSNIQTTMIPPGGAAVVEFTARVPGNFNLVDHSITRAIDKGAMATIIVDGPPQPEIFNAGA